MIVADLGDRLRFVTQSDHAHLASALLALWRADDLPTHPRREALLFAAREHDNGWREEDAAPSCDPTSGRPLDFIALPVPRRQALWQRGIERHLEHRPYEAALILEHALALHAGRRDDPVWTETLQDWDTQREALIERLDAEGDTPVAEVLAADYPWIDQSDTLSLAVAARWADPFEHRGIRATLEPATETLHLEPFPFAGVTTFELPCREIPKRRWASDRALATDLATARWQQLSIKAAPLAT